jgi:MFS family permease
MPLVFSIGSIIGPIIGGALANPLNRPSEDRTSGPFLWKYPYVLPNLVAAGFFTVGITIGFLFLRESLDVGRRDYGIILGNKLIAWLSGPISDLKAFILRRPVYTRLPTSEPVTPVKSAHDEESGSTDGEPAPKLAPPSWSEALNNQTIIMLVAYTFLAMHNTAFDQIISVFMHQARTGPDVVTDVPPLRFNKGFGMSKYKYQAPLKHT